MIGQSVTRRVWLACGLALIIFTVGRFSAQTLKFDLVGTIAEPVERVQVHAGYVYLAADQTLTLFDISNPAAPRRAGAYTFPERIWGFRVVGSLVYVAADFFGLGILDVSNTAAPALRGSVKTPGQAKSVAVSGTMAAVADHMAGVDLIDVSDLAKPVLLDSFYLDGYAKDVAVSGSLAYAVDAPTGFYVFDLSKSGPFEALSVQQSASAPGSIAIAQAPGTRGQKIAVVVGNGAPVRNITDATTWTLQMYDVSNPTAPTRVASFRTPSGRPLRVAMMGTRAYVADGREGLQVVDLSAPAAPRLVGGHRTPTPARDVAVADSLVFVVVGTGGGGQVLILKERP